MNGSDPGASASIKSADQTILPSDDSDYLRFDNANINMTDTVLSCGSYAFSVEGLAPENWDTHNRFYVYVTINDDESGEELSYKTGSYSDSSHPDGKFVINFAPLNISTNATVYVQIVTNEIASGPALVSSASDTRANVVKKIGKAEFPLTS